MVSKNTMSIGKINSAEERPNQIPLSARPLLLLKYLEIVVEEVCDIKPWPENLIKKIPRARRYMLFINEKIIDEKNKIPTTIIEYLNNFNSSIFFPNQTRSRLEQIVAIA